MKLTLLLTALTTLAASQAYAADDFAVRDLWFFGKKGIISGSFAPEFTQEQVKLEGTAGTNVTTTLVLPYQIYYSLCDHLKFGFAPTYIYSDPEGGSSTSGFVEPSLRAVWRALEQNEHIGFLDVTVDVSPTWGESKKDSQFRGGTQVSVGFSLGKNYDKFAYKVTPTFTYSTVGHKENAPDTDAAFNWSLLGQGQYDINNKFSVLADLYFAMPGDVKSSTSKTKTDFIIGLNPGVKYAIIDELALSLMGTYAYTKGSVNSAALGGSKDLTTNSYGAIVKVDFGF